MNNEKIRFIKAKSKPTKDGKHYWNYYLIFGNGSPIQIKLAFPSAGLLKLLYAVAEECKISTLSKVDPVKDGE